jgi:antitoxin VapB
MSLNIKNEETHRLARQLAEATGESIVTAVAEAVRERLYRLKNQKRKERIRKIRDDFAARLKGTPLPDHGELLYDDKGLPK